MEASNALNRPPLEDQAMSSNGSNKKPRPQPEQALRCPRCDSTNTKFCYYNNYSLSQPRYFCKSCRRYWTQGGSLRNVPVGGGCRKSATAKRSSSSSNSPSSTLKIIRAQDPLHQNLQIPSFLAPPPPPQQAAALTYDPSELTLAFAGFQQAAATRAPFMGLGLDFRALDHHPFLLGNPNPSSIPGGFQSQLQYYGFGGGVEGGLVHDHHHGGTSLATPTGSHGSSSKVVDGDQEEGLKVMVDHDLPSWSNGGSDGGGDIVSNSNMDLGSSGIRDYWNNTLGFSWHGLINSSSLM